MMKIDTVFTQRADSVIESRDESRARRPLGIKVTWNCQTVDTDGWQYVSGPMALELAADDSDWGEQDSLANIPQRTMLGWVAAAVATGGDE